MTDILVIYDSEHGTTAALARAVAEGVRWHPGCNAVLRRISPSPAGQDDRTPLLESALELARFDGIALGSPVHFGTMSAAMRAFLDGTLPLWTSGALQGMPATVFMGSGSGAGREAAILSYWSTLALHGMLIVAPGMDGAAEVEQHIGQAHTPFGACTAAAMPGATRPSQGELHVARRQGARLARAASLLGRRASEAARAAGELMEAAAGHVPDTIRTDVGQRLHELGLTLPDVPAPVGNYASFRRSGSLVFINQIALENGRVRHPGVIGHGVDGDQARAATRATLLNVLAVLQEACDGDLGRVAGCVQMTGFFAVGADFTDHASLLDEASRILVGLWGPAGRHARAAVGASSLPMGSPCELQAIFELSH